MAPLLASSQANPFDGGARVSVGRVFSARLMVQRLSSFLVASL